MEDEKIKIILETCFWSDIEPFILSAIKEENISMFLLRERTNPVDENAIAICIDYQKAIEICKKNYDHYCISLVNQPVTENRKWLRVGYIKRDQKLYDITIDDTNYSFSLSDFIQEFLDLPDDLIEIFLFEDYFNFFNNNMYVEIKIDDLKKIINKLSATRIQNKF